MRLEQSGNAKKRASHEKKKLAFQVFLIVILAISIFALVLGFILLHRHANKEIDDKVESKVTMMHKFAPRTKVRRPLEGNLFHFIISSDCTSYQRWETLTLLHSAERVSQCGKFTWIVSGCLPEGSHENGKGRGGAHSDILTASMIEEALDRHFPDRKLETQDEASCEVRPQVHFTPDYSDMSVYGGPYADGTKKRIYIRNGKEQRSYYGNIYKFNNKPNGLLHWIQAYLKSTTPSDNEAIVLIDPDFLFLAPFRLEEIVVAPRKPVGARYGLGGQWLEFNRTQICGADSLCTKATSADVSKYYTVGPPYILHIQDVENLARKWAALVPPTYDVYRKFA